MANRNIVIVGRGDSVSRISYDATARKASAQDYNGIVGADVKGSTRINCLSVVVRTMEQLKEKDLSKETAPTLILTIGMVVDSINDGTFKYWILGDGKKLSGDAVNETELELWNKFAELYKDMYLYVTFKNVSNVKIPKNPRYAISMEQRALNEYAEKAWDRIKVTAPEIEESEDEAL
jgi:hypothetical protein